MGKQAVQNEITKNQCEPVKNRVGERASDLVLNAPASHNLIALLTTISQWVETV